MFWIDMVLSISLPFAFFGGFVLVMNWFMGRMSVKVDLNRLHADAPRDRDMSPLFVSESIYRARMLKLDQEMQRARQRSFGG